MGARLDGWEQVDNPRSGGGTYDPENEGYPWRIVLHTIEGRGFPNLATHPYPPQLWYDPVSRRKAQTIPLDRSGFALYQASDAPYYTNRARAIQVELVGYAEEAASWPDSSLRNIAADVIVPVVQWVRSQGGTVDLSDPAVPLPGAIPNSAREDAPQRLAPGVWAFGPIGMCGHRHVPMGDDHWDAGGLDMRTLAAYARAALGESTDDFWSALMADPRVDDLFNRLTLLEKRANQTWAATGWYEGDPAKAAPPIFTRLDEAVRAAGGANWQVGNVPAVAGNESKTISSQVRHLVEVVDKAAAGTASIDYDKLVAALLKALAGRATAVVEAESEEAA